MRAQLTQNPEAPQVFCRLLCPGNSQLNPPLGGQSYARSVEKSGPLDVIRVIQGRLRRLQGAWLSINEKVAALSFLRYADRFEF